MTALVVLGIFFAVLAAVASLGWVADSRPVAGCDVPSDVFAPRR
jgi:hypothetical protein